MATSLSSIITMMIAAMILAPVVAQTVTVTPAPTQQPAPPTTPPADPPKTLPDRIQDAIDNTPPRGPLEPGMRDPEVQKRFEELRKAGVPLPSAKYIGDLPPEIRAMFPRNKWGQPVRAFVEDPFNPGTYRFEDPSTVRNASRSGTQFDWMDWWEPNRERYWPQRPGKPQWEVGDVPSRVLAALIIAAASKDPGTRAQAALALAMTKHPRAMEHLSKLTLDSNDGVAIHAWAAIGLLNSTDAVDFLESPPKTRREIVGWTLAVGLSEKATEAMWNAMPRLVDESGSPEAQRLALWAMRMHLPQGTRDKLLQAINLTRDPVFISEILRGLAKVHHPEDIANLVQLARGNFDGAKWDSITALNQIGMGRQPTFQKVAEMHQRILSTPLEPGKVGARPGPGAPMTAAEANSHLRSYRHPALAALAEMESPDGAVLDALRGDLRSVDLVQRPGGRQELQIRTRGQAVDRGRTVRGVQLPLMFGRVQSSGRPTALLGLGRLGLPDDLERAVSILSMNEAEIEPNRTVIPNRGDPFRDEAALAIGLYLYNGGLRNEHAGLRSGATGVLIPAGADSLFLYYQDTTEPLDVRAACALAIGLAGNPDFAVRIKQRMGAFQPGQEIIWGFSIWALGMLGDPAAIELAGAHIGPARARVNVEEFLARQGRASPIPVNELIARRAAVDGLAALGDPRALPLLYGEWGKNPFLDLEVARAIARCRRPLADDSPPGRLDPFLGAMARLAVQERNTDAATSAAMTLGMLYETGQRARLGELVAGASPITVTSQDAAPSERVLALGNPFYYLVLRRTNLAPQAPQQPQQPAPRGR